MAKIKKKIDFKLKYKWSDLSEDLRDYFFRRGVLTGILFLIGIIMLIFIHINSVTTLYFISLLVYFVWQGYYFIQTLWGNVLTFVGKVENLNIKEKAFINPVTKNTKYTLYGKSSLSMVVSRTNSDGSKENANFIVPIGAQFDAKANDLLAVYVLKNSVWRKNKNTFQITNPILIKVIAS